MKKITQIPKLKPRKQDAHKGDFGKVCIIAGSLGMTGAAALAGKAALRSGAGLVRIATSKSSLPIVAALEPSYTTIALPEDKQGRISDAAIAEILNIAQQNNTIAFGCGVDQSRGLVRIAETLIAQQGLSLLIDADGLNNLSKIKNWPEKVKANIILTPHPGEMARLWKGLFREPLPEQRQEQACQLAKRTNAIVVLKGAGTIVTDGEKFYINSTGNPGMATAGAGDVLTGTIAALIAQQPDLFTAAVLGTYVHGRAGDIAAEKTGQLSLIATDIIEKLPQAFMEIKNR